MEQAGRILRAQASRKQVFLSILPLLTEGLIRPAQQTPKGLRPASKDHQQIAEQVRALHNKQQEAGENAEAFVAMTNLLEQACNLSLRTEAFPKGIECYMCAYRYRKVFLTCFFLLSPPKISLKGKLRNREPPFLICRSRRFCAAVFLSAAGRMMMLKYFGWALALLGRVHILAEETNVAQEKHNRFVPESSTEEEKAESWRFLALEAQKNLSPGCASLLPHPWRSL